MNCGMIADSAYSRSGHRPGTRWWGTGGAGHRASASPLGGAEATPRGSPQMGRSRSLRGFGAERQNSTKDLRRTQGTEPPRPEPVLAVSAPGTFHTRQRRRRSRGWSRRRGPAPCTQNFWYLSSRCMGPQSTRSRRCSSSGTPWSGDAASSCLKAELRVAADVGVIVASRRCAVDGGAGDVDVAARARAVEPRST